METFGSQLLSLSVICEKHSLNILLDKEKRKFSCIFNLKYIFDITMHLFCLTIQTTSAEGGQLQLHRVQPLNPTQISGIMRP